MQIVRKQILECNERRMITFTSEAQQNIPFTERRIPRVLAPQWHLDWAVQFGRYFVQFPSPGDMSFYDRMAYGLEPVVRSRRRAPPAAPARSDHGRIGSTPG